MSSNTPIRAKHEPVFCNNPINSNQQLSTSVLLVPTSDHYCVQHNLLNQPGRLPENPKTYIGKLGSSSKKNGFYVKI
jgi:hypothetical protein